MGYVLLIAGGLVAILLYKPEWITNHWYHWLKWWD